jgi:hypothetical protein
MLVVAFQKRVSASPPGSCRPTRKVNCHLEPSGIRGPQEPVFVRGVVKRREGFVSQSFFEAGHYAGKCASAQSPFGYQRDTSAITPVTDWLLRSNCPCIELGGEVGQWNQPSPKLRDDGVSHAAAPWLQCQECTRSNLSGMCPVRTPEKHPPPPPPTPRGYYFF